jgi:trehalose 6-phosphate phosphatase
MDRLSSAHRQGVRLALLFDYDGTLTPIVEHPALARLEPRTARLLRRLSGCPGVTVGVISGRGLDDLRGMVGLPGLHYAGNSGLELDLLGKRLTHPEAKANQGLVQRLVRRLGVIATDYAGAWVEDKRLGLTLHYRQVAPHRLADLLERAGRVVRAAASRLRVVEGPMAWEITPALRWDKGSALRLILDSIGPPVLPAYAGDGANDAEAVAAAAALKGVTLGIGACAPSSSQYRLHDPAALTTFLTCLTESLGGSRAAPVA